MAALSEAVSAHPARERLLQDLLAWGAPRPDADPGLPGQLRAQLEAGVAALGPALPAAAATARGGSLWVTRSLLAAPDGVPARSPHTRASARGVLTHRAVELDLTERHADQVADVVARAWTAEASRRPGDPASLSAWLNAQPPAAASDLQTEVAELLAGFREVWPPLPAATVVPTLARRHVVRLAGGRVQLRGVPDLVLHSPVRDGRARTLVVDLATGRPADDRDRRELRFLALLVTVATGEVPFRWATFHVTEGRIEVEELAASRLQEAAADVVATVGRLVSQAPGSMAS